MCDTRVARFSFFHHLHSPTLSGQYWMCCSNLTAGMMRCNINSWFVQLTSNITNLFLLSLACYPFCPAAIMPFQHTKGGKGQAELCWPHVCLTIETTEMTVPLWFCLLLYSHIHGCWLLQSGCYSLMGSCYSTCIRGYSEIWLVRYSNQKELCKFC